MLRLFHSPQTRSTRILWLLEELNARDKVDVELVTIARQDGSTVADPRNPHPDGKVPVLQHDSTVIMESGAIVLYLSDMFPKAGLGHGIGDALRGEYLTWLHYYGNVMEPVLTVKFSEMTPDTLFTQSFRGFDEMSDRLTGALESQAFLLGDKFSAADLLISAPFIWFSAMAPDTKPVQDWIARCAARPHFARVTAEDQRILDEK